MTEVKISETIPDIPPKAEKKIAEINSSVTRGRLSFNEAKILAINADSLEVPEAVQTLVAEVVGHKFGFEAFSPPENSGREPFQYVVRYLQLEERFKVDLKKAINEFSRVNWPQLLQPFATDPVPTLIPFHTSVLTCECAVIDLKARTNSPINPGKGPTRLDMLQRPINSPLIHGELPFIDRAHWPDVLARFTQFETAKRISANSELATPKAIMDIITYPTFFNIQGLLRPTPDKPSKFNLFTV